MNMRELLTGWMDGRTLQGRSRNPEIAKREGWCDLSAFDPDIASLSLPPGREYRLKPEIVKVEFTAREADDLTIILDAGFRSFDSDYLSQQAAKLIGILNAAKDKAE